ncbi:type VI secretion system baseplate subunit TssF [Sphingomonas sp. 37zxx]|uniref:type VI secretion system baseplate subunit TssF n=1 Tax=Sphingomonas sp. 37zxx TaxID=1550073 RepID=UPI00053BDFAA|nr:type VI secretion system baseplate subunit TssF [Sphingomonas sp. 37zxx]
MLADANLLRYYFAELTALREEGRSFAQQHPDIAAALDLAGNEDQDPQVARLVESVAFLVARVRREFDAGFPLIPSALLDQLYPQLAAPLPAMGVAHFEVAPEKYALLQNVTVPRDVALFARLDAGIECRFRTSSAFTLWPLVPQDIALMPASDLDVRGAGPSVLAALRVTLRCSGTLNFAKVKPGKLRFFLDGDTATRFALHDLLGAHCIGVAAAAGAGKARLVPGLLPTAHGFEPDEAILPMSAVGHHGYRLLQEYFAFPAKFLFFDLDGFDPAAFGDADAVTLYFLFDDRPRGQLTISPESLRLNCVPIVNLFPRTSEPIRLDHVRSEYLLQPDARSPAASEVHSIASVTRTAAPAGEAAVLPYFRVGTAAAASGLRWLGRRRPVSTGMLEGTEMMLAFVDPNLDPGVPADKVLFAQMLCTNRRLTRELTLATPLQIESDLPIQRIALTGAMTAPHDPPMGGARLWQLVSQLSLNKLSLDRGDASRDALQQMLMLYASGPDQATNRQINGITRLATRPTAARLRTPSWRPLVRGTEIELTVSSFAFAGGSALLFGAVMERFFALYASVNSFTRLALCRDQQQERWKEWPNRAGAKPLL